LKKTNYIAFLNSLHNVITGILLFVIVFIGYKAVGILTGHTIAALLISIISFLVLGKLLNIFKTIENTDYVKKIFVYALPLLLTSSSYFLLLRGPIVLLGALTSPERVAYLNIPMRIVEIASLPGYSLSVVTVPFFTKAIKSNNDHPWLYVKVIKYYLLLYLPVSVFIGVAAFKLIPTVFGSNYANAIPVLIILSCYLPFFAVTNFSGTALDFLGYAKQKSFIFAAITGIAIILTYLLVPRLGELGAAISIALPYTVFSCYTIYKSAKVCRVVIHRYSRILLGHLITSLIAGAVASVILQYLSGVLALIFAFLGFMLVFLGIAFTLKLLKIKDIIGIISFLIRKNR
jgi:O-antigen/teichoic acid export membrane protein